VPTIVWVIIAVVAVAAVYFLFIRKPETPTLPAESKPPLKAAKKPTKPSEPKKGKDTAAKKEALKTAAASKDVASDADKESDDEDIPVDEPSGDGEAASPAPPPAPISRREKDVAGLRRGLKKVRSEGGLFGRLKALFTGKKELDPALVEQMEEILLTSDVGVKTTEALLGDIRERLEKNELDDPDRVWDALRKRANELLDLSGDGPLRNHGTPTVVLMVGVNGTGKTTTIGKLATKFQGDGKKVLLVAGDTFRAAAVAQLKAWGKRVGCDIHAGEDGADPASVVFDAVERGAAEGYDLILVDTAGRLHTKSNLMDELSKVVRTCGKAYEGAPHETLLVVDGTTGQNALQQAEQFGATLDLTGIVLTKLDGTAKGGVVLAIAQEHGLPVRYIGVGERANDLRDFNAEEFVEAVLGGGDDTAEAA
jgi:fused signal recognition particle receptor